MPPRSRLLGLLTGVLLVGSLHAGVGDPTLETDHPHYAGEGAFQTVEQCVRRATADQTAAQDRAIALYLWILSHQYHLASPQEWCQPGRTPNSQKSDNDLIVQDAERARFSYGYALCGTVHAWNTVYWRALGMRARTRSFPGHTNSEVEYDGSWHALDTDMAGLVFRRDGVIAGYDDVRKDVSIFDVKKPPLPQYPFAWPSDRDAMKQGWQEVARGGDWARMYNTAYVGQPGLVALRAGETFTRYFDRDHFGGPAKRRFWHVQKGGPSRDWTFVNQGTPKHDGAKSNSRGNASYCNGEFVYRPNLAKDSYREGVATETANVAPGEHGLRSKDGAKASVTFAHFSPYVIAGCPVDGVNPMTKPATGGLVVTGQAAGTLTVAVSADLGQTWTEAGTVSGQFEKDLTDVVKGRYGWQVRFGWQGEAGLDAVTFTTVTQVSQAIYPQLRPDGCNVTYRAASRAVVPVLPNFGTPEAVAGRYEAKPLRSANVVYGNQGPKSRFAYQVKGNKPGGIVFRVESPSALLAISAAARFNVRVPAPAGCDFRLDLSTDEGKTWQPLGKADVPTDNELSSGWMYGKADVAGAKKTSALVRLNLYQGGHSVGLLAAEVYGIRATPPPQALVLTYAWKEKGVVKTHVEKIAAGTAEAKFRVPTGPDISDEYVRLEAMP